MGNSQNGFDREKIISEVVWSHNLFKAFELLPDVYFWAKDKKGRFLKVNQNFMRNSGRHLEREIYGKTDLDVWPESLAVEYIKDDNMVLETGNNLVDRIEFLAHEDGSRSWFSTTKFPLKDAQGEIVGTLGFSRELEKTLSQVNPIMKIVPAINYIQRFYNTPIQIEEIAREIKMTEEEIRNRFLRMFQKSFEDYVVEVRLDNSSKLLQQTDLSIQEIGECCGFASQQEFVSIFQSYKKTTPQEYRESHKKQSN